MLEMLFEKVFGLVHYLRAHYDKNLSTLEGCFLTRSIIVLHNLDDSSLLNWIITELRKKRCKSCGCSSADTSYSIFTKFKEHWYKLLMHNFLIEKSNILAKILSKKLFSTPIISSLAESFCDVFNVGGSLFWLYFCKHNM